MAGRTLRGEQAGATRELLLTAAERLFAEHGVYAVSNRQVSEAAGQGNNTAVGYHFGTKADLVRAIVRKHATRIEEIRARLVAALADPGDVRGWVDCLVRPVLEHLAALGAPTWYARFCAQVVADPALHLIMVEEALTSPSLQRIIEGLRRCLPDLPPQVRAERGEMVRHLIVHVAAERERALAEHTPTPRPTWDEAATGLADAVVGMWLAPVTPGS
ncbi:TetR family transcriptional regulator [Streptomyces zinciresistens K42]|uniref:TetR family transcriptional regulator n=1 Tax=Streptomyces zinciresistens K42 TaxID=700597 RepID=G2GI35_9ACTN|nr:TetR family transcriptional regulator [Streptomyces zinciresistens]EGX56838.1 TetR family transcriptional regulator [Streptomyces zinciresistens K42]